MIQPMSKEVMIDVKLLTNPKKFYKTKQCVELVNSRDNQMTIEGCQKPAINNYAIEVNNLKDNIAIILQTIKHKCVVSIDPAQQNLELVQEHLGNIVENLRNKMKSSYDEIVALVVGGRAYDSSNKFADKSIQLTDSICEFIEAEHIPSTKLLEQNLSRNSTGMNVYSHRQHAIISGSSINELADLNPSTTQELQEAGEKIFDIFEVSSYAPIRFVDKVLPASSTNVRFLM